MFSGLIAHAGTVASIDGDAARGITLAVDAPDAIADGVAIGDSVAINGVCLTVTAFDARTMRFDVVPETVARTGFDRAARRRSPQRRAVAARRRPDRRPLRVRSRRRQRVDPREGARRARVSAARRASRRASRAYIVEKGYVTIDGVSLTVASVTSERFTVALIPETAKRTTLGTKGPGDRVNLEIDPVARYAQGAAVAYAHHDAGPTADEVAWAYEI